MKVIVVLSKNKNRFVGILPFYFCITLFNQDLQDQVVSAVELLVLEDLVLLELAV
jgi:hypothetical protein